MATSEPAHGSSAQTQEFTFDPAAHGVGGVDVLLSNRRVPAIERQIHRAAEYLYTEAGRLAGGSDDPLQPGVVDDAGL